MGRRRQSREMAFKILFQIDVGKLELEPVLRYFMQDQKAAPEVVRYAEELVRGTLAELARIDQSIQTTTQHWDISRIAKVDRTLLRLGAYELSRCPDVPKSVVIDEAIELAKKYGGPESGTFINGILDKIDQPGS